jgi:hypothetical protein
MEPVGVFEEVLQRVDVRLAEYLSRCVGRGEDPRNFGPGGLTRASGNA